MNIVKEYWGRIFLKDAWYVAAWINEIITEFQQVIVLGEAQFGITPVKIGGSLQ